jgi:hypothetical protein
MAHWKAVQLLPIVAPLRHQSVHQHHEAAVVGRFGQVSHLVDEDVFEAFAWFLGEI